MTIVVANKNVMLTPIDVAARPGLALSAINVANSPFHPSRRVPPTSATSAIAGTAAAGGRAISTMGNSTPAPTHHARAGTRRPA